MQRRNTGGSPLRHAKSCVAPVEMGAFSPRTHSRDAAGRRWLFGVGVEFVQDLFESVQLLAGFA